MRCVDLDDRPGREHLLQFGGGAEGGELARLDDGDAMTVLRLVKVMRRHQHRHAVPREIADQVPESSSRERIDAAGRLVEKHDSGFVEDGATKREALAPSAGQIACERVFASQQARHLEHELAARHETFTRQSVDAAEELDVLIDRQRLVERELLRHVADRAFHAFGVLAHIDAANERRA